MYTLKILKFKKQQNKIFIKLYFSSNFQLKNVFLSKLYFQKHQSQGEVALRIFLMILYCF